MFARALNYVFGVCPLQKNQEEQQRLYTALKQEMAVQTAKHGSPATTALIIPGVMAANVTVFISVFGATSSLMDSKVRS